MIDKIGIQLGYLETKIDKMKERRRNGKPKFLGQWKGRMYFGLSFNIVLLSTLVLGFKCCIWRLIVWSCHWLFVLPIWYNCWTLLVSKVVFNVGESFLYKVYVIWNKVSASFDSELFCSSILNFRITVRETKYVITTDNIKEYIIAVDNYH